MPDKLKVFKNLFNEVFDHNGKVTLCGREKCKELIRAARAVTPIYGDEESGFMDTEALQSLYKRLFPSTKDEEE